jgi:hypothetical protein
MGTPLARENA